MKPSTPISPFRPDTLASTLLAVLVCLSGAPALLAGTPAEAAPRTYSNASLARMTGSRVRLRTGPSRNHFPFSYAEKGQTLVVLGERNGWSEILIPRWIPVYVHRDYVQSQGAGTGIVKASNLIVRVTPARKHEAVGVVPRGTPVQILGAESEWLKIAPPLGSTAWVSSQYVRKEQPLVAGEVRSVWASLRGSAPVDMARVDPVPPPRTTENPVPGVPSARSAGYDSRDLPGRARTASSVEGRASARGNEITIPTRLASRRLSTVWQQLRSEALASAGGTTHLDRAHRSFEHVMMNSEDLTEIRQARDGMKFVDELRDRQSTVLSALEILERAKAEDERLRQQLKNIRISRFSLSGGKDNQASPFIARGWLKSNGRFLGRQGTHSLHKGGRVYYYLRSQDKSIDLDRYLGRRVAVRGVVVELEPRYGTDLIMVTGVEVLSGR